MVALPYRCAECGSQWPANRETCAFCGSANRVDNEVVEAVTPAQRQYVPPAALERDYHPDVSQTPYVAAPLVCAALVGSLVYLSARGTSGAVGYAVLAALLTGANVWICCLIYITKARVDRMSALLDDVHRNTRRGN